MDILEAVREFANWLSDSNSKLNESSGEKTYVWGLPAYKSCSGRLMCPFAGKCKDGCYARQGFYNMPSVKRKKEKCYELSKLSIFVETIDREIKKRGIKRVRVHDSGDFYSRKYARKWLEIARLNPQTDFYAYTKSVSLIKKLREEWPNNFRFIFSFGGKQDSLINTKYDQHARVFSDLESLERAGYQDGSKDDHVAACGKFMKIGLIYHGAKDKNWGKI